MKIALLADEHGNPLDEACAALVDAKPDLVIHAGDLSSHHHRDTESLGDNDRTGQATNFLDSWNTVHVFGHVHTGRGCARERSARFVNARCVMMGTG